MNQDLMQRGKGIKLAVFDVDGVLTDGRLYFLEDGSEFKTFNTLDGQGIKMLMASGVTTAIISGRKTPWSNAGPGTSVSRTSTKAGRTNWWCLTACSPNWA